MPFIIDHGNGDRELKGLQHTLELLGMTREEYTNFQKADLQSIVAKGDVPLQEMTLEDAMAAGLSPEEYLDVTNEG